MTNNDVLRRIRYVFDFDDSKMMALFALVDVEVTRELVSAWLKKEDDAGFEACPDVMLATFLNGLIVEKRGKNDGPKAVPETRLTHNIVLRKLKIALNLKDEDVLALLTRAGFNLGRHELSALFRKAGHKNYRACQSQVLRNFLQGVQMVYRDDDAKTSSVWNNKD